MFNKIKELFLGKEENKTTPRSNTENKINDIYKKNNVWRGIRADEEVDKQIKIDLLDLEYKEITDRAFGISEYETYKKVYSKAINQNNIFNKYSAEYKDLCEEYLSLLPQIVEYERKRKELVGYGNINHCHRLLKQYILLLDKQGEYVKEGEVIHFLMSLGITDDGTKGGLQQRAEKLMSKIGKQRSKMFVGGHLTNKETGEVIE